MALEPGEALALSGAHARLRPDVWAGLLALLEAIHRGAAAETQAGVAHARHVVEIIDAVERAAETGQTQVLEPSEMA